MSKLSLVIIPYTEIVIPLENETAILGGEGHFFCQIRLQMNEILKVRVDGKLTSVPHDSPQDLVISAAQTSMNDSLINITIIITATSERNNTEVECYSATIPGASASKAVLIVQGTAVCIIRTWAFLIIKILQQVLQPSLK